MSGNAARYHVKFIILEIGINEMLIRCVCLQIVDKETLEAVESIKCPIVL